jgi:V-type H+-transporting ATPase proteolipid subunit
MIFSSTCFIVYAECYNNVDAYLLFDYVAMGAAYGTSKAGIGIAGLGGFKPELIMRVRSYPQRLSFPDSRLTTYLIPIFLHPLVPHSCSHVGYRRSIWPGSVSSDIRRRSVIGLSAYVAVHFICLTNPYKVKSSEYPLAAGFIHLGAGLACGMTGISAGYAIGIVGDAVSSLHSSPKRPVLSGNRRLPVCSCIRA